MKPPRNEPSFEFFTSETPFTTRHFTVFFNEDGAVEKTFTESIYSITKYTALENVVLSIDEPTGNLDRDTQNEIMEIFRELTARGKCAILVSHSPEVAEMCDERYELTKISGKNNKKRM